jgi:hypothetical protein
MCSDGQRAFKAVHRLGAHRTCLHAQTSCYPHSHIICLTLQPLLYPSKQFVSGLDLACLKERRGRCTPLPSTLAVKGNARLRLGVAPLGCRRLSWRPGTGCCSPVDDLRPRTKIVQIILDAVDDIRFCEKLSDKWMTELDKCVANRFSQYLVSSNDNNGFTESRVIQEARRTRANAEILSWALEEIG